MACIVDPQDANIKVTQVAVEPLRLPNLPKMLVTQYVIELLTLPAPPGNMRVTQAVIELPASLLPPSTGSQLYEA